MAIYIFSWKAGQQRGRGEAFCDSLRDPASANNYAGKPLPCLADYTFYTEVL